MLPRWITGKTAPASALSAPPFKPGMPGSFVALADISGSMYGCLDHLVRGIEQVNQGYPLLRVFAFADHCTETSTGELLDFGRKMGARDWRDLRLYAIGSETNLHAGIDAISLLHPAYTVIISDGGVFCLDRESTIAAARRMTGRIDCLYCGYDLSPRQNLPVEKMNGLELLTEIARHGHGELFPSYSLQSAGDFAHLLRERIGIVTHRRFHHHYAPDIHIHHEG